ncbi:MAG: class I SAM-dependent methyltransferase [Verrucomicrobiota bacterium]
MRTRVLQQELLETYPDDHPDAICGREDLLLVNAVMGNHRWIERMLRQHHQPGWKITEIGAGDGALSRRFLESDICGASSLHAFDLAARPPAWPGEAGWTQGDLFQQPLPDSEVLIANLFLHHFTDEQLSLLGSRISPRTRLILAAEPERRWIHTMMGRIFCWLAELHPITQFDMQVSIRAGFRDDELPHSLGLDAKEWHWQQKATLLGGYRFMALRRPSQTDPPRLKLKSVG